MRTLSYLVSGKGFYLDSIDCLNIDIRCRLVDRTERKLDKVPGYNMWQLRNGGEVQGLNIFSLMNFWFLN